MFESLETLRTPTKSRCMLSDLKQVINVRFPWMKFWPHLHLLKIMKSNPLFQNFPKWINNKLPVLYVTIIFIDFLPCECSSSIFSTSRIIKVRKSGIYSVTILYWTRVLVVILTSVSYPNLGCFEKRVELFFSILNFHR